MEGRLGWGQEVPAGGGRSSQFQNCWGSQLGGGCRSLRLEWVQEGGGAGSSLLREGERVWLGGREGWDASTEESRPPPLAKPLIHTMFT